MRGLKPKNEYGYETLRKVASFTDAWIETRTRRANSSHSRVASFTDAWIETIFMIWKIQKPLCRIFYRCVD